MIDFRIGDFVVRKEKDRNVFWRVRCEAAGVDIARAFPIQDLVLENGRIVRINLGFGDCNFDATYFSLYKRNEVKEI